MHATEQLKSNTNMLIRHASLRQIQVFESVARHANFTKAADELHLTQPTVSAQVKNLSEAVGMPLYEQIGRSIHLTEVGLKVAASCREIIDQFSNLEIALNDFKGMKRGRLRISVVTTAKYFMPLVLGDFCKQYPDIELSLNICNRHNIVQRLEHNLDDLYILGQIPPNSLELETTSFAPNPLVVIANKNHELVGQPVGLERIAKEPFIMREKGSGLRSAVEKAFDEKGLSINERLTMHTNEAILHCVIGDLGVACVSKHALYLDQVNSPIVELDVEGFPIEKEWNIVYPTGKELSLIAKSFYAFLLANGSNFIKL